MSSPTPWNRSIDLQRYPGLLYFIWMRFLNLIGFMPRVTVTTVPDERGRALRITYRVYFMHKITYSNRWFYGLPVRATTADGNSFIGHGRSWAYTACDSVQCGGKQKVHEIRFHDANPVI